MFWGPGRSWDVLGVGATRHGAARVPRSGWNPPAHALAWWQGVLNFQAKKQP